jgi:aminopeptidase N
MPVSQPTLLGLLAVAYLLTAAAAHPARNAPGPAQPGDDPPPRRFHVSHYDVQLHPHLATKTITGTTVMTLSLDDGERNVVVNRGSLQIDAVREGPEPRPFEVAGTMLRVSLEPGRPAARELTIDYHGAPSSGLVFVPERDQIYTLFSTSQWMPAIDEPDARATLRLRLTIPRGWTGTASGREVSRRSIGDMQQVEWRQARAVPTYTFGFAVGRFVTATERAAGATLRYFGGAVTARDLRTIFRETPQMIAFFESRAGVPLPRGEYAQALVARTVGQEMAGLSVMSDEYGRAVLSDPSAIGLIAHELAHQWWGNMVTCQAFTHFWLNEGVATYMAAAYREHRFGRDVYLRDVASMRARVEQVRERGNDRSLVFPEWRRPSADDRTLVYQKGAYLLHELRERLGDQPFWAGVRLYTTRYFGRSVTTADFKAALEEASGKDLDDFFARYVF